MKRSEHLIAAGLIGSVVVGATSVVILRVAGRSVDPDWPTQAAFDNPVWLAAGEIIGAIACVLAAASLFSIGLRHGGASAFAPLGVMCLAVSVLGVVLVAALDLAYARAAQDGVLQAIAFGQRWNWWSGVGWLLFAVLGLLGVAFLGIGLARGNRPLRYPALAVVASLVVILVFITVGAVLLAASLIWLGLSVERGTSSLVRRDLHPAR